MEELKLSETDLYDKIAEMNSDLQGSHLPTKQKMQMFSVEKTGIFNAYYPAGISFSFLLLLGLTFRFNLFHICFDVLKTLSK